MRTLGWVGWPKGAYAMSFLPYRGAWQLSIMVYLYHYCDDLPRDINTNIWRDYEAQVELY